MSREKKVDRIVPEFCAVDLNPCDGKCKCLHHDNCKERANPKELLSGRQYRQLLSSCPVKPQEEQEQDGEQENDDEDE